MGRMTTVPKKQLIKAWAKIIGIDDITADYYYDMLLEVMKNRLESGESVLLPKIGNITFATSRSFKSNMTGQHIPPHRRIKFVPNLRLARKIRVNTREYPIR